MIQNLFSTILKQHHKLLYYPIIINILHTMLCYFLLTLQNLTKIQNANVLNRRKLNLSFEFLYKIVSFQIKNILIHFMLHTIFMQNLRFQYLYCSLCMRFLLHILKSFTIIFFISIFQNIFFQKIRTVQENWEAFLI